jgi:hypothetical protein
VGERLIDDSPKVAIYPESSPEFSRSSGNPRQKRIIYQVTKVNHLRLVRGDIVGAG